MNGLPYYKAYPRDFLEGTIGMTFELKGAYRLLLDLIYMQGGALPDDPRYISGLLGCSVRAWNRYRNDLLLMGKIRVVGDVLRNFRADKELETLSSFAERQRENRSRPNKNKDLQTPRCDHTEPEPLRDTVEAKASPGVAAEETPAADVPVPTMKDLIWHHGRAVLVASGKPDGSARAIIGKWLKTHGEEATLAAIDRCRREEALDPVAFIEGCFRHRRKAAEPRPGDVRTTGDGRRQVFQAGNGWMTEHA
jgi:uncharacterized protein YdaU (DUF1376 family)